MKSRPKYTLTIIFTLALTSCGTLQTAPLPVPITPTTSVPETDSANIGRSEHHQLPVHATWQIQYSGEFDLSLDVDVYNLDLVEITPTEIENLHTRGIYVMCYFSAGSWEDWRSDAHLFSEKFIGNDYEGWPGEKWLDVREIDALKPIMESRIRMAAEKGCDGVGPDNVDGYTNETGFSLTYEDQLFYNRWLSQTAHTYDLEIGLKNDMNQIKDLLPYFDWALNEECFTYNECELLTPFVDAGKPVFVIEYETKPADFCSQAKALGINAIYKNWDLDSYRQTCP